AADRPLIPEADLERCGASTTLRTQGSCATRPCWAFRPPAEWRCCVTLALPSGTTWRQWRPRNSESATRDPRSRRAQPMIDIATFAKEELKLTLTAAQDEIVTSFVGGRFSQSVLQCGRRGGKS